jgi:hypothetical protein
VNAPKVDPVSALLICAETLRTAARGIETIELAAAQRDDLRTLLADIRRGAFMAITLAALELRQQPGVLPAAGPVYTNLHATGPDLAVLVRRRETQR